MADTEYTYSIADDTASGVLASDLLVSQIEGSAIVTALKHIDTSGDELDVWFVDVLSSADETLLGGVVGAHDGTGYEAPSESTRVENFVFVADDNNPYYRVKKTKWQVVARVRFRGSDDMGVPLAVKAVMWGDGGGEVWARIYDVTNDAFVCEGASTSSADPAIVPLGEVAPVSSGEAVWELQAKQSGGEGRLHSLSIDYS